MDTHWQSLYLLDGLDWLQYALRTVEYLRDSFYNHKLRY